MVDHRSEMQKRFIREEMVRPILGAALGKHIRYPICKQFATSHAAGSAVAGLAARAILTELKQLRDMANTCYGELTCEYVFTPKKLAEHVHILSTVRSFIGRLLTRNGSHNGNLLIQTLRRIPQHCFDDYSRSISSIGKTLDQQIRDMAALLREIEQDRKKYSKKRIESLLRMQVSVRLSGVCEELGHLEERVGAIAAQISTDWDMDVAHIEQGDLCRFQE